MVFDLGLLGACIELLGGADMARDPICGMDVNEGNPSGGTSEYRGKTYYFCSAGCKRTFDADPAKHAGKT